MVKKVKTASAVRLALNRRSQDAAQWPWSETRAQSPTPSTAAWSPAWFACSPLRALPPSTRWIPLPAHSSSGLCSLSHLPLAEFSAAGFQRCVLWRLSPMPCATWGAAPLHCCTVSAQLSPVHTVQLSVPAASGISKSPRTARGLGCWWPARVELAWTPLSIRKMGTQV